MYNLVIHDLNYSGFKILLFLIISWLGITFSIQYLFLDNNILYYQTYGNQLSIVSIDNMLKFSRKWQWVGYIILPFVILLRVFFTSVLLYIGIFFTELQIEFGKLFKIALLVDFIFVLSAFTKLIILIFFKEVNTLEDLQFQPLSVAELIDKNAIDPLFVYPLSILNIFEFAYFLLLSLLLANVLRDANNERPFRFGDSLQLVTTSYGSGLLLWVLLVMFLTLSMS